MNQLQLRGVGTPLLTPFTSDGSIATGLFVEHARSCLENGSHFLVPFGTTGEAASIAMAARMSALEALVEAGTVHPEQLVPGTGMTSLADAITLTKHARDLDVAAVLLLPPFFIKDAQDGGLYRYMADLIEQIADDGLRIVLYHIPKYTGIGFSPALTRKLVLNFPGIVVGYKDSGGQWAHTAQIMRAAPDISVFPGSEAMLPQAIATGGAGCISASSNVNVSGIRALYDALVDGNEADAKDLTLEVTHFRTTLEQSGLVLGSKSLLAKRTGEVGWTRTLPPLQDAPAELSPEFAALLASQMDEMSSK